MEAINNRGYSLIIIDASSRALRHAEQLDQVCMNVALDTLHQIALTRDICLLLEDRYEKVLGRDVIDDVMGAASKVGGMLLLLYIANAARVTQH